MAKTFGCCRYVYNKMLELKSTLYTTEKKSVSIFELSKKITGMKQLEETKWLKEVSAQSLQWSLRNLDSSFTRFFREKKGYPTFKNKYSKQSFGNPQDVKADFKNGRLFMPKFNHGIKCVFHRRFEGKIKTATVSKTPSGKYFVSILVEQDVMEPTRKQPSKERTLGIDLGVKDFLVTSDGQKVANPRHLNKKLKQLKRQQRKLSRKQKGSNNRNKQRLKVAKLHEKVANCRNDFLHKTTKTIVNNQNYDTVAIETLNVAGMVKSHKLARHIQDVGWGMFSEYLRYKCDWYSKNLIEIGQFEPSTKTCSDCGKINKNITLKDRAWTCECGAKHDRDINAAKNIKHFAFCKQDTTFVGRDTPEFTLAEITSVIGEARSHGVCSVA
jgi:putative transposase